MRSGGLSSPPLAVPFQASHLPLAGRFVPQPQPTCRRSHSGLKSPRLWVFTAFFCRNREEIKGGLGGKRPFPPSQPTEGFRRAPRQGTMPYRRFPCATGSSPLDHKLPLPRPGPGSARLGVPSGLVVHPSMAGPARPAVARPDDGVGTWRPTLRESGPLPARMGQPRLATWIHSTSRNLVPFNAPQQAAVVAARGSAPRSNATPSLSIL